MTTSSENPPNPTDGRLPEALQPTATDSAASTTAVPRFPANALSMVERVSAFDKPAAALASALQRTLPSGVSSVLLGRWLGHPLHPILVTVPIGAWVAVPMLDVAGQRDAARRLLAFGILAAAPASITGAVEFTTLDTPQRRVALAHVVANSAGISCLAQSWLRRRREAQKSGFAWTLAGLAIAGVGGALGGHLSYSQGAGVYRER